MKRAQKLNIWQKILLELLWILCRAFALLPHFVRYGIFKHMVYALLCHILHYRRKVIMQNLRNSFPDKGEEELYEICKKSYMNLSEQIISIVSQSGVSDETMLERMEVINAEETDHKIGNRNAVLMTAHFGPWEACITMGLVFKRHELVGVYHKLENPMMDELMKRIRRRTNSQLVDINSTMRYFLQNKDKKPIVLGLISDQNPAYRPNLYWHRFLHQWSAFYDGAEVIALKYKLPVFYFTPYKIKDGHYKGKYTMIYDGEEEVAPNVIMERYVRLLERDINENPHMWMWSHRRWKHTPPQELLSQKI